MRRVGLPQPHGYNHYIDGTPAAKGDEIWILTPDDIAAIKALLAIYDKRTKGLGPTMLEQQMADLLRPLVDES